MYLIVNVNAKFTHYNNKLFCIYIQPVHSINYYLIRLTVIGKFNIRLEVYINIIAEHCFLSISKFDILGIKRCNDF